MAQDKAQLNPLLVKAIPAAEDLIRRENFSIENLCHAVDAPLKELGAAIGSVDELFLHVNDRFMSAYLEKAAALESTASGDLEAVCLLSAGWLDHALAHPQSMNVLLQHRWADGFERPDWYFARVNACFAPIEKRLANLAPQAPAEALAGVSRGLYAHICGLYFLSINERARPAGISSLRKLLDLHISCLVKGLQA